jgi:large subunit ribosomal protein L24
MEMAKINIRKNDQVIVTTGREKGKKGRVVEVDRGKGRILVEKINMIKRHTKPSGQTRQGGIIEKEGPLHVSNVLLFCAKCNKGVRVARKRLDDGTGVRICSSCREQLD